MTALERLAKVARGFWPTEDPDEMLHAGRVAMWDWIKVAEAFGAVRVDYGVELEHAVYQEIVAMSPALSALEQAASTKRAESAGERALDDSIAALIRRLKQQVIEAREDADATPDDVAHGW